jgi:hypothetical protein
MNDQGSHGAVVTQAGAMASTDPRVQRYRQAERAWWANHGLQLVEGGGHAP